MADAMAKRIHCTVLFGSETGMAESLAKTLGDVFSQAFHVKVSIY